MGPAVMVGHVDLRGRTRGVSRLSELQAGDLITVENGAPALPFPTGSGRRVAQVDRVLNHLQTREQRPDAIDEYLLAGSRRADSPPG
jgi:hypothetical protein